MKKILSWAKKYQFVLYSLVLSFIVLFLTSKNSWLYPLNDWVDANAFFTVGKGMMNGVVPYRDLFEQKGILLYFIYGIGYLLSSKTFHGVFIIEVLFFTVFLYYLKKIIALFLDSRYAYLILPIVAFLITTSFSFTHGGACEEFCLPFFAITLYSFLKHFKEKEISSKELVLNGVLAGCVLLIKYTLLGFWFAFMLFLFFDMVRKKEYKKATLSCLWFLLGMALPLLIAGVYFLWTHSLKDFIECYFTINMTAYNETELPIFEKILEIYIGTIKSLVNNGLLVFFSIILLPLFVSNLKIDKYAKFTLVGMALITALGLFWGMHFYRYYMIPMFIFIILACVSIAYYFKRSLDQVVKWKYSSLVYSGIFLVMVGLCYFNANYKDMIFMDKKDMFQYEFAEYIHNYENPTLLNMGYLDGGLYTTTGIVPNTKFFEVQNIPYDKFPDNLDDMRYNVENKNVMFVLYYTRKDLDYVKEKDGYIFQYYDLVMEREYLFEEDLYHAFLFKVKSNVIS